MLALADLEDQFPDLIRLPGGIVLCADVTACSTYHYYVAPAAETGGDADLLLVSEDRIDDAFATAVLDQARNEPFAEVLRKRTLAANGYGFDALMLAPPQFHAYFAGRLDAERDRLILCVPAYVSEFAGNEDADTFRLLMNKVVPHRDWSRYAHPRTELRFDNPATGGGTGDGYVFATFDLVMRELDNLGGITQGFIELVNWRGAVLELLSPAPGRVVVIDGRDDTSRREVDKADTADLIWAFLAEQ